MPSELRWFLFSKPTHGNTVITVHRTSEGVIENWLGTLRASAATSGFLFVGESRPAMDEVEDLFARVPHHLLITEAARFILPMSYAGTAGPAIATIAAGKRFSPMAVYIATGWGCDESTLSSIGTAHMGPVGSPTHLDVDLARDQSRFRDLLQQIDSTDPFAIAHIAPAWALPVLLGSLDLTVRCENVLLKDKHIGTIEQLAHFSAQESLGWKNFGRKSIADLAGSLLEFLNAGPIGIVAVATKPTPVPSCAAEVQQQGAVEQRSAVEGNRTTLLAVFEKSLAGLKLPKQAAVRERLAFSGRKRTLEDVAADLGVTRERVRQLEAAYLTRVAPKHGIPSLLSTKLKVLQCNRSIPLYLDLLQIEDGWFAGWIDRLPCLAEIIQRLGPDGVKIITFQGRAVVASVDETGWAALKSRTLEYLKTRVRTGMTKADVAAAVEGFLLSAGCAELRNEFYLEISGLLHFGVTPDCLEEHLLEVGRTLYNKLHAFLESVDEPLHYQEIWEAFCVETGQALTLRAVHAALARSDAIYFGRGVYGTWRHFPVAAEIRDEIRQEAEEIINSAELSEKQWHVSELLLAIQEGRPDVPEVLDKYLLNIILGTSNRVRSVGRYVWSAATSGSRSAADRIEVAGACLHAIQSAGRPLTIEEMKEAVSRIRGVGEFFLIHSNDKIARLAPSTWGLLDRDFGLDREGRRSLVDSLLLQIERRGSGVHLSEVMAVAREVFPVPECVTPYMLMSICAIDGRLKLYKGQYLGATGWGESRRLTIPQVLDRHPEFMGEPRTIDEISRFIGAAMGRPVGNQDVVNVVKVWGARFDHTAKVWQRFSASSEWEDSDITQSAFEREFSGSGPNS